MADSRHLLVDGYNCAHAWPGLRGLVRGRLDLAVDRVVHRVRVIHDFLGWSVTVVFDGKGATLDLEHPDDSETLTVVYSAAGQTADAVIEQMLARVPSADGWRVATNDRALGQMALASGADVISANALEEWTEQTARLASEALQRRSAKTEAAWRKGRATP